MFHFQKNNRPCSNCGIVGHGYRDCQKPITSFGTILYRVNQVDWSQEKSLLSASSYTGLETVFPNIQILLIQRRDSLGFVDLMRGKYPVNDNDYIKKQISGMTDKERDKLLNRDFDDLWVDMWGPESSEQQYKKEKETSRNKLLALRDGGILKTCIDECTNHWSTPEWGFPKGRRDMHESELDCALREMNEETGILTTEVEVIHNMDPLCETFFGSNHVHYCHKYFLLYVPAIKEVKLDATNLHMKQEIGDIGWFSLQDALEKIRPDNIEKREILTRIGSLLRNFCAVIHPS